MAVTWQLLSSLEEFVRVTHLGAKTLTGPSRVRSGRLLKALKRIDAWVIVRLQPATPHCNEATGSLTFLKELLVLIRVVALLESIGGHWQGVHDRCRPLFIKVLPANLLLLLERLTDFLLPVSLCVCGDRAHDLLSEGLPLILLKTLAIEGGAAAEWAHDVCVWRKYALLHSKALIGRTRHTGFDVNA